MVIASIGLMPAMIADDLAKSRQLDRGRGQEVRAIDRFSLRFEQNEKRRWFF